MQLFTRDDRSTHPSAFFKLRPIAVIMAAALLLPACGGGGGDTPASSGPGNQLTDSSNQSPGTGGSGSNSDAGGSDAGGETLPESRSQNIDNRTSTKRTATGCDGMRVRLEADYSERSSLDTGAFFAEGARQNAGFYIDTSGGIGGENGGKGGDGGCVDIFQPGGMGGLRVKGPSSSGEAVVADASFQAATPSVNLGSNPLVIDADTAIKVVTTEPAKGVPYLLRSRTSLFISDGNSQTGDETPVTGVHVKAGQTVTFGLNTGLTASDSSYLELFLDNDIHNEGVITTENAGNGVVRGGLELNVASYIGAAGSAVDISGAGSARDGGGLDIIADYSIFNAGTFSTAGADGSVGRGGAGGKLNLTAQAGIQNTGPMHTRGGDAGGAGSGGAGGDVDVQTRYGNILNSGDITTLGGAGVTLGGRGGNIALRVTRAGAVRNSGDLIGAGGDATQGPAGNGGDVGLYADGGGYRDENMVMQVSLANSGDLVSRGGSTSAAEHDGGYAGDVNLKVYYGSLTQARQPAGHMEVSGNIDASGGHAAPSGSGRGGDGGLVAFDLDARLHSLDQHLNLLGYGEINASGGDGNKGGNAGPVGMMTQFGDTAAEFLTPSGDVENHANIIAKGGDALRAGLGGRGGDVTLETEYYCGMFDVVFYPILTEIKTMEHTTNSGTIDTSGGMNVAVTKDSTSDENEELAGNAGDVLLWGYNRIANDGDITANGGDDSGNNRGTGGKGGNVSLLTELGAARNGAEIAANGGDAVKRGGDAATLVTIQAANAVDNSAVISATGGDADPTVSGSRGGNGGFIEMFSLTPVSVTNSGLLNFDGGTGEAAGTGGGAALGGQCTDGVCPGSN